MNYNPNLSTILWLTNSGWHFVAPTAAERRRPYKDRLYPPRPYWFRFPRDPGDTYICEMSFRRAQEAEHRRLSAKYKKPSAR